MSERQRFIRPATVARPALVAACIRRVATMLDAGDDQRKVTYFAHLNDAAGSREGLAAWSQAALIIADECDMTTVQLRAVAMTIDKGVQGELGR